jgi:thioredoxin 1
MMQELPITLSDLNFQEEVLNSKCPVLVSLEAEWSATCRIIDPILRKISVELSGIAKIGKLDVEKNRVGDNLPCKSLPAFLFYNHGELVDIRFGLASSDELKSMILKLSSNSYEG